MTDSTTGATAVLEPRDAAGTEISTTTPLTPPASIDAEATEPPASTDEPASGRRRRRWIAPVALGLAGLVLLGGGFGIGYAVGAASAPTSQIQDGQFPGQPGEGGPDGGQGGQGGPGGQAPGGTTDGGTSTDSGSGTTDGSTS